MKKTYYWGIAFAAIAMLPFCFAYSNRTPILSSSKEKPILLPEQKKTSSQSEKKIQIVFALDATGSMSGLIHTAKDKIWSITSSFAQDSNASVEVGLVFYRDKGDAFVTRRIALSTDLDNVYEKLMSIKADGGGDTPESVNQGLHEAVSLMDWSKDTSVYKSIFLVGDCPPHMDYKDDVKYYESCQLAKEKDLLINTILMGNDKGAKKIWNEISHCAGGDFMQVNMDANNLAVSTPYDKDIATYSYRIDQTRLYYGTHEEKQKQTIKSAQSQKLNTSLSSETAARRAEFNNNTKSGKDVYFGDHELLNDYKEKKVDLSLLKEDEWPKELQNLSPSQKQEHLERLLKERENLQTELNALILKRKAYIENELKKRDKKEVEESFDKKVYDNVKKQAAKKRIDVKGDVKY